MTVAGWVQIVVLIALLTGLTPLLGGYMARVYSGERVGIAVVLGPLERLLYRVFRVELSEEHRWPEYARSLLIFSAAGWPNPTQLDPQGQPRRVCDRESELGAALRSPEHARAPRPGG